MLKKTYPILLSVFLITLTAWFLWKFSRYITLSSIPWTYNGFYGILYITAVVTIFAGVGALFLKKNIFGYLLAIAALFSVGAVGLSPIFSVLLLILSGTLLGAIVFRTVGLEWNLPIYYPIYFSVGIGIYAVLVSFMALLPINYTIVYFILLLFPILVWCRQLKQMMDSVIRVQQLISEEITRHWLSSLVILIVSSIYLAMALLPEFGYDAQTHHLRVPSYMFFHHRWSFDGAEHYGAVLPLNGNWIYTIVYMLGGEAGVRLANLAICGVITLHIVLLSKRWGLGDMYSVGLLLFLSLPVTYLVTTSLFIENPLTLFITSTFCVLLFFAEKRDKCFLYIAALLLGVAMGTKIQSAFLISSVFFSIFIDRHIVKAIIQSPGIFKGIIISVLLFFIIGIIPYAVAYTKTGNPLFPYYNAIFKSPYHDINTSFNPAFWREGVDLNTLKNITFSSDKYIEGQVGSAGWYFFILLPFTIISSIVYRKKHAFFLITSSILFIIIVFQFQSYLRYIYPIYPILVAFIVQSIGSLRRESKIVGNTAYFIAWAQIPLNLLFLPACNFWYREFNFSALFSHNARKEFIYEKAPYRQAVDYMNTVEKSNVHVGIVMNPLIWNLESKPFNANIFSYPFSNSFYYANTDNKMLKLLKENSIHYLLVDENYHYLKVYNIMSIIHSITRIEKQFGSISVRVLRDDFLFRDQMVKNSDFGSIDGWSLTDSTSYDKENQSIVVTSTKVATQGIPVVSGEKLKMTVRVRAIREGSFFRIQINWMDSKGKFIGTDLTPYRGTGDFQDYIREITVPEGATSGIIYANGHGDGDLVEFTSVSLRR